ncbi:Flp family type IVb pilin [Lutispora sp.]|uniref:Flp family type IVb pilin n=1 Tax=Lutispora sp. TaxID=2828727 RepID=UPI002B1F4C4E|nr:Flp family type IVb pilin [Lutispora sp.]MEA4963554.1 Flp family type IVb pilin [Lutispora sp.]
MKMMINLLKDEKGQALSEYGLVLGIVVIAVIAILGVLKDKIISLFQKIADALSI